MGLGLAGWFWLRISPEAAVRCRPEDVLLRLLLARVWRAGAEVAGRLSSSPYWPLGGAV